MKKFLSVILTLVIMLSVAACSDSKTEIKVATTLSTAAQSSPESIPEENTTELSADATTNGPQTGHCTEESAASGSTDNRTSTTKNSFSTTKNQVTTTNKPVTTTQKVTTTSPSSPKLPSYSPETEIVTLFNKINDYRVQNGLNKLVLDPELCKMAYVRAQEQDSVQGHTRPDGTSYYSILDEYNYNYMGCGENISFFWNVSASESFDNWKNSPTHNDNMLNSKWTKSGIAMRRNSDGTYSIVHLFVC